MDERLEPSRLPRQSVDGKPLAAPRATHAGARFSFAVAALALGAAALARALAHFALGDVPHVQDEQAYWLQARTLAIGHLATPPLLPRASFTMWFVDDRWARFGIFPPGWPAVLAAGFVARAPFWVNPLLHAATTALLAATVGAIAGHRRGSPRGGESALEPDHLRVLAAALYGFSPQALLLAASLMSHATVAFAAAVVLFAATRELQGRGSKGLAAAAGAAIGLAALSRPLCACAIATTAFAALAISLSPALAPSARGPRRGALERALVAAVPLAAMLALLFAYNHALTGHATRFPQTMYFEEHLPPSDDPAFLYHPGCNDLGIGPGHGCQRVMREGFHTLGNAVSNSGDNLIAWLLLAGGGPLVFLAAALALRRAWTASAPLFVLALPVPLVVGLYALYWYSGTCYGARFYHAALPGLLGLAALGVAAIRPRLARSAVLGAWLAWNGVALVAGTRELAREYWGADARFRRLQDHWTGPPALVMLAFDREVFPVDPPFWTTRVFPPNDVWHPYQRAGAALALNAPELDGPVVFAKYHPALVGALARRFPGRELWLYVETPDPARDRLTRYVADPEAPATEPVPAENFEAYTVD